MSSVTSGIVADIFCLQTVNIISPCPLSLLELELYIYYLPCCISSSVVFLFVSLRCILDNFSDLPISYYLGNFVSSVVKSVLIFKFSHIFFIFRNSVSFVDLGHF